MAVFKVETKNKVDINKKPRVYFTCHPEDFEKYFKKVCDDIFKTHDCAIYYTEDMTEIIAEDEKAVDLGRNNLFVVPVTFKLLSTPNRAMDEDIPYALKEHIPVLPIMMEPGIDEFYSKPDKFGELQYLNPYSTDLTEISYEEKLKRYLESVLISDELEKRVRAAFDAYIFLSYRKKDRKYANELMRLIHSYPECRDIAIWFDEFLTPGESFKENIEKILDDCKLFTLLVTPQLLEKVVDKNGEERDNYVISTELPLARKKKEEKGTDIFAVEMEETDREALSAISIEDYTNPENADFRARLLETISRMAITTNNTPEHNFLIGLAYLKGLDVEVNYTKGITLITDVAESGLEVAMEQLIDIYSAQQNRTQQHYWVEKLINSTTENYINAPSEQTALGLLKALTKKHHLISSLLKYKRPPRKREDSYNVFTEDRLSEGSYTEPISVEVYNECLEFYGLLENFFAEAIQKYPTIQVSKIIIEANKSKNFVFGGYRSVEKAYEMLAKLSGQKDDYIEAILFSSYDFSDIAMAKLFFDFALQRIDDENLIFKCALKAANTGLMEATKYCLSHLAADKKWYVEIELREQLVECTLKKISDSSEEKEIEEFLSAFIEYIKSMKNLARHFCFTPKAVDYYPLREIRPLMKEELTWDSRVRYVEQNLDYAIELASNWYERNGNIFFLRAECFLCEELFSIVMLERSLNKRKKLLLLTQSVEDKMSLIQLCEKIINKNIKIENIKEMHLRILQTKKDYIFSKKDFIEYVEYYAFLVKQFSDEHYLLAESNDIIKLLEPLILNGKREIHSSQKNFHMGDIETAEEKLYVETYLSSIHQLINHAILEKNHEGAQKLQEKVLMTLNNTLQNKIYTDNFLTKQLRTEYRFYSKILWINKDYLKSCGALFKGLLATSYLLKK